MNNLKVNEFYLVDLSNFLTAKEDSFLLIKIISHVGFGYRYQAVRSNMALFKEGNLISL